jgi:clan AA aspartic protease
VIEGEVDPDGQPCVFLMIRGRPWRALIDTGFNGALQLPYALGAEVRAAYVGRTRSILADGTQIREDYYDVRFPFDGEIIPAEATFSAAEEILIGTYLLRDHRLEINFPARTVLLHRER